MALLLDTHAFLWFLAGDKALSRPARRAIEADDETVFVSAASAWEIATKFRLGKLPDAAAVAAAIAPVIEEKGFTSLAISVEHAQQAGAFAADHKDPFDRMLAAQALLEGLILVSNDEAFDAFGVNRLW